MKRLLTFLIVGGCLLGLSIFGKFDILSNDNIRQVCIVSKSKIESEDFIQSGNQFYYNYSLKDAKETLPNFQNIDGIILYIENLNVDEVFSFYKAESFKGGDVEGNKVFYGYSPYYNECYYQNNKKVNMQLVVKENQIILGFPAILIGF